MQKARAGSSWFFVDESGDSTFYDKRGRLIVGQGGCSPILIIGFFETPDPEPIRQAVLDLQQELVSDPYLLKTSSLAKRPSIQKTAIALHANDDMPEVRYRMYKLISTLNIRAQIAVARKSEPVFRQHYSSRPNLFYDHLISFMFSRVLHRYENNHICFAHRGSSKRMAPLTAAIQQGITHFEQEYNCSVTTGINVEIQTPTGEPCLSVIDYLNWAVFQAYVWREMRFFRSIQHRVSVLVDLYDEPRRWFSRRRPFDITKVTPL